MGYGNDVRITPTDLKIAVDANRDGEIHIDDDSDKSTADKPFRFWVNDDYDVGEDYDVEGPNIEQQDVEKRTNASDNYPAGPDSSDDKISCNRDLEDFTGLMIQLATNPFPASYRVELKANGLAINVFKASWQSDLSYLRTTPEADTQRQQPHLFRLENLQSKELPKELIDDAGIIRLTFEASQQSKFTDSNLEVTVKDSSGNVVASSKLFITLRSFKHFYEHWTAGDTTVKDVEIPFEARHPDDNTFEYSESSPGLSVNGASTSDDYILFVHGYRMQKWERRAFAETAFKRLYLQGYKGKVGFFSWPTEWTDFENSLEMTGINYDQLVNAVYDPSLYNRCEEQARKSGHEPLYHLLLNLRVRFGVNHVHVFAHSMGNVVISEALRSHPFGDKLLRTYIACQSAEVAHAFDPSLTPIRPTSLLDINNTPDLYRFNPPSPRFTLTEEETAGDNYHKDLHTRVANMINYTNLGDPALGAWDLNQDLKPELGFGLNLQLRNLVPLIVNLSTYSYEPRYPYDFKPPDHTTLYQQTEDHYFINPPGISSGKQELFWPTSRFSILAHVIPARSRAMGATEVTREFSENVDLGQLPFLFGAGTYDHSAEFQSTNMKRKSFYSKLLTDFELLPTE